MPRKHHRRPEETGVVDEERVRRGVERVQVSADGSWLVRHITTDGATKVYRCPGCDQEIGVGVAHIVAWPNDERGDLNDRRHWHTGCWKARATRAPTLRRPPLWR
jgi:hypothetical protein